VAKPEAGAARPAAEIFPTVGRALLSVFRLTTGKNTHFTGEPEFTTILLVSSRYRSPSTRRIRPKNWNLLGTKVVYERLSVVVRFQVESLAMESWRVWEGWRQDTAGKIVQDVVGCLDQPPFFQFVTVYAPRKKDDNIFGAIILKGCYTECLQELASPRITEPWF
jgi:hypothetical protein